MGRTLSKLFLFLIVPFMVFAETSGKIDGIVTDKQTGEPLMGVNVVIKGTSMGAATDTEGRYYILNVPPGIYEMEARYIGYAMVRVTNVRVTVDITTTIDVNLETEAIQGQEVVVVSERPLIEKKATNERRVVRSEDIENLPVRGTQEIIALQTGAVKVGADLHIRGGRREEIAYYVDGVYMVNDYDRFDRPEAGEVSNLALEEVSFQAGGFDAEYGSATAGLVNMSTKTGGNRFQLSGEVASDEFLSKTKAVLGTYSYGQNTYNLSFGGPITNSLTFYMNAEHQYNYDRRTTSAAHPVGTFLGDLNEDGPHQYEEYEVTSAYGPLPYNSENKWMSSGNILWDKKKFRLKIGGNYTNNNWYVYNNNRAPYAIESTPLWKSQTYSLYGRATLTLDSQTLMNFQVSKFQDAYQNGHPEYWEDFLLYGLRSMNMTNIRSWAALSEDDFDSLFQSQAGIMRNIIKDTANYEVVDGILMYNTDLPNNGSDPLTKTAYADFKAPGTVDGVFEKNETGYMGFNWDLKAQRGVHELKVGAEYRAYTVRYYRLGAPELLASKLYNNTPYTSSQYTNLYTAGDPTITKYADYNAYIENYWYQAYKYAYAENMGYTYDGTEYIDSDLADDRDGPRRPVVGGIYVQDKVELRDLIMNIGLRYDYISPNNYYFRDPQKIILDSLGLIAENVYMDEDGEYTSYAPTYALDGSAVDLEGVSQLSKRKAYNQVSPRLGLAFPVTDQTVFHAQYGKYVQQPQLNRMFISYVRFASNLGQGNFTISGNPELEPVQTTSYEIGFKQQLGVNSSVDVTVYYKQLTGYVQVRNVLNASPVVYATYVNGDYGSIKGLSFSYNMRRTGYVRAFLNYTLQYAGGTGSTGTGQYKIAWQSGNYPTFVSPLDFDQRHTGSFNLDFRTTQRDIIKDAGANFLFSFGSGRRYTPVEVTSYVFPKISDTPVAALNSGIMPWVYQLDMKLDKNFKVGPMKANVYFWVQNLTDHKNVRNVHDGTGEADYDGWFSTASGAAWADDPDNNVDLYIMKMQEPYYYESPRTVLLGLRFFIGQN